MDETAQSAFESRFRDQAWVDDPVLGFVRPDEYLATSPLRPDAGWASIESVCETETPARTVTEVRFHRREESGGSTPVPVGVVWDRTGASDIARLYVDKTHVGATTARPPIVGPDRTLRLSPMMERYLSALNSGDYAAMHEMVDPGGMVDSPEGPMPMHAFIDLLGVIPEFATNGVPVQFCTVTTAGAVSACEFVSWRTPPHAGLSVYEFGDDGLITRARMYEGPFQNA